MDYNSLGKGGTRGVKVAFLDPATGAHKALYYFSADLSDDGLKRNSAVLRFCNSLGPTNSLLKASSYLLHQNGFSIARDYLLRVSASILQDDSGIPLRSARRTSGSPGESLFSRMWIRKVDFALRGFYAAAGKP